MSNSMSFRLIGATMIVATILVACSSSGIAPSQEPQQPGQPVVPGPPGQPGQPGAPNPPVPTPVQPGQPGQPVPPAPVPTPTNASGGGGAPAPTPTPVKNTIVDLGIDNIYPDSAGRIYLTIKNYGNVDFDGTASANCTGETVNNAGVTSKLTPVPIIFIFKGASGFKQDYPTTYSRDPSISSMTVSCTLHPPAGDSNSSNDHMGPTKVK